MDVKSIARNVSVAFVAQALTFAVSAVVTLLVPKVLDVENFGYWQLFVFYSTYVGFFMLGLNDGCYLINGGKRRDELNKPSVNSQFVTGFIFEVFLGLALALAVLCSNLGESRAFVLYCISAFIVLRCSSAFFGYMFQAINETKLYSGSCILERLIFLVAVIAFLVFGVEDFYPYVLAYCFSTFCQFVFCCWHARDIMRSGLLPLRTAFAHTFKSIRVGIKLMLANIASSLILGVARAAIDAAWGISSFGQLSLALALCNFFLAFVSQFAMVLFPALRQAKQEEIRSVTAYIRDFLSFVMPLTYLLQFPLYLVCLLWLPQYEQGLGYLALILPICVFDSKTNLCCFTYFKVARMEARMLAINVATVLLSSIGVIAGVMVLNSVDAVVLAVVIGLVIRSLYCEKAINQLLHLCTKKRIVFGELAMTIVFVASHYLLSLPMAFILCTVLYIVFALANRREIKALAIPIVKRLKHAE